MFQIGEDPFTLYVAGTFIVDTAFFWPFASIFSYFDIAGGPHVLERFPTPIHFSQIMTSMSHLMWIADTRSSRAPTTLLIKRSSNG